MAALKDKLLEHLTTYVIAGLIALLTVFSDRIVGDIKIAINRADLRASQYDEVAAALSSHVFAVENVSEYYERGWTTKESVTSLA
ncbi:MAG TPA: hypothetical protein VLK84_20200, partial [Longimicrobium sp.]|nr:hypothetical protein [Longimicrobium sp.]